MRLLFVIDSLVGGGAEVSTRAMVNELARNGHSIRVVVRREPLAPIGLDDSIEVRLISDGNFVSRVRALRGEIYDFNADLVHTVLYWSDQLGRLAALGTRVPVVSSLVSTPHSAAARAASGIPRWKLELVRGLDVLTGWVGVTRFHAVSEGVAAANSRALCIRRRKIEVVERGRSRDVLGVFSSERRRKVRTALGLADTDLVLLGIGRQEPLKRFEDLVSCLSEVRRARADAHLLLAGRPGAGTPAIEGALKARPADADRVLLLGERDDVPDLLCAADVLLIASVAEGTAGVALEAMALKCPVVCTDVEGVRGVLDHERNSLLVGVASPSALAEGVRRLSADEPLRESLVDCGAKDFERRFDLDAAVARTVRFYRGVVEA